MKDLSRDFSLYIHIPFCVSKCAYCDFLSFADRSCMAKYFVALCEEIKAKGKGVKAPVDHIYVGGGTPSLAYEYFPALKKAIDGSFTLRADAEISMECNPESVTPAFVAAAKAFGVNRVSLGVQTLSDPLLKTIGRAHDRKTALAALDLLTRNFSSVNADVMVGLPGQTKEDVTETLNVLTSYPINHISCYSLILEEGTPLFAAAERGEFAVDDDFAVDLYDLACEKLKKAGFCRYEISNFCKNGAVCGYNLSVWQYGEYLGLGLGASSFLRSKSLRLKNTKETSVYLSSNGSAGQTVEQVSKEEQVKEFVMLGLRLEEGMDLAVFKQIFGFDFLEKYAERVKKLEKTLVVTPSRIAIAPEYFYVSNTIIQELIF
ncbi:MAG: radical SAM family heme chaperone HemW [Clostridia bacterium]|nr:radical SAM family heme chaperone HemW [Clostridia bacterium]